MCCGDRLNPQPEGDTHDLTQNTENNVARLLRGVILGGLFAVLNLIALVTLVISVSPDSPSYPRAALSGLAVVGLSLATIWATGFWGRWGLAVFFSLAPVILILDFTINPLFPVGTILAAGLLYGTCQHTAKANTR